jgi:hypothetical protein
MIEDGYGSPMARPLYCSADLSLYQPQPAAIRWSLGYLGTYSEDRQPYLEKTVACAGRAASCGTVRGRGIQISRKNTLAKECRSHRPTNTHHSTVRNVSR